MTPPATAALIDTHAHLMDPRFEADLDQVLERAWEAGLRAIVCVGYDLDSSRRAVALAGAYAGVFAAVGIHPNYVAQAGPDDMRQIAALAEAPRVVGIGETGLDNYRAFSSPQLQEAYLLRHLELAAERQLPVVVHNREASARLGEVLAGWAQGAAGRGGVLHCFSGDRLMLERCVAASFYLSFAGPLTFKHVGWLAEAAREVPAERMVVETDAPYLAPVPVRGRRNEPAFVAHTARRLAELRGEPFHQVAEATSRNAMRLFPGLRETLRS
ncbi:MAG: TatD family hydrolase [Chloroflexi bacterium]|nr:TatD family hydrolase [Chloroflexota bacterium]